MNDDIEIIEIKEDNRNKFINNNKLQIIILIALAFGNIFLPFILRFYEKNSSLFLSVFLNIISILSLLYAVIISIYTKSQNVKNISKIYVSIVVFLILFFTLLKMVAGFLY